MIIPFHKYQGTGNDFIMVDQRNHQYLNYDDQQIIEHLCHRRFGIGADGLILLENATGADFRMVYFNADGREGSMCGNGGRCIIAFAHALNIFRKETIFLAVDGKHQGKINDDGTVSLHMQDVKSIERLDENIFELNTGSPHYVLFCNEIPNDIVTEGAKIRYNNKYKKDGINVNFVKFSDDGLVVATYERGVEDETYSCGTGVTAAALSYGEMLNKHGKSAISIKTKGGNLKITFERDHPLLSNIWLSGPAEMVFEGKYELEKP